MPMGSFFSFLLSLFFFSERTYADGSGIQWVNKPCEGTFNTLKRPSGVECCCLLSGTLTLKCQASKTPTSPPTF